MDGGSSAWVFQAHPREWRIDDFLSDVKSGATESGVRWLVTRHADDIARGDRVFLWRAGAGREAGVVALAWVETDPALMADDKPQYRLSDDKFRGDRLRVALEVERVLDRPLYRPKLEFDPELSEMSILRSPQGTNFR